MRPSRSINNVMGMLVSLYCFPKLSLPITTGYFIAVCPPVSGSLSKARKGFTVFHPFSSVETPITAKPPSLYLASNSMYHGISVLHPPHHVDQKSRRTTFPLQVDRLMVSSLAPVRLVARNL